MKLQIVLPNETAGADPRRLVELSVEAEQLGYDMAWLPDHLMPPGEYGSTYGGVYEPLVTMGWLAAATTRIRFGTSVLVLPLRNPFVVAKQVATLDRLSNGRVTLGVGIGWDQVEFEAVGAEFRTRAGRTSEAIRLIRHLFEHGGGPFTGRWYGFEMGVFEPRPDRPVPIMIGGVSDPALRRIARYADVWQGVGLTPDEFADRLARLRTVQDELKSAGEEIRMVSPGTRLEWNGPLDAVGEVAKTAAGFAAAGAEHLAIHFGNPENGYADRMAALARACREMLNP